jgi:inhibitor of KinA
MSVEIAPLGDLAVRVSFGNEIKESIHQKVQQFLLNIEEKQIKGIVEYVPTYTTLTIYYNPREISYGQLVEKIESTLNNPKASPSKKQWVYEIPVYYGGETGPDLAFVAEYHRMSEQEVVDIHTGNEYLIYMIGFVPGFPYLGGLSKQIAVPRLQHPRSKVATGSVGIGGDQTGIYPAEVPSGWRIIGITPVSLFHIEKSPPALLSAGNYVKFYSVDYSEYLSIKMSRNFQVKRREYKSDRS